jgi:ribosome-associated protein
MTPQKLNDTIIKILKEKGGGDVKSIDLTEKSSVADYFVIATGKNANNVAALANDLQSKLAEKEVLASRKEGVSDGRWAVLDFNSVIVHIFNADTRDFYCLENLWK